MYVPLFQKHSRNSLVLTNSTLTLFNISEMAQIAPYLLLSSIVCSYFLLFLTNCCRCIITTGSDGDIRIWKGVDDDDPNTRCVGEFILYHVYYDNRILASTDLNTVQAYTYPDGDRDGTEFRFTAPVTCIKVTDKVGFCSFFGDSSNFYLCI